MCIQEKNHNTGGVATWVEHALMHTGVSVDIGTTTDNVLAKVTQSAFVL